MPSQPVWLYQGGEKGSKEVNKMIENVQYHHIYHHMAPSDSFLSGIPSSILTWDRPFGNNAQTWQSPPLTVRGRHLLSLPDNSARFGGGGGGGRLGDSSTERMWGAEHARRVLQFDKDLRHLLSSGMLNESTVAAHFCPIYFNSTESSR